MLSLREQCLRTNDINHYNAALVHYSSNVIENFCFLFVISVLSISVFFDTVRAAHAPEAVPVANACDIYCHY